MQKQAQAPTIAVLKTMGVERFNVTCTRTECRHAAKLEFEVARLPDASPFPAIAARRRFLCTACGGHETQITPDWTTHRAIGN